MTSSQFAQIVKNELPFVANAQQDALIEALARFCAGLRTKSEGSSHTDHPTWKPTSDKTFVINGYAGTGKTSLTSALVRALSKFNIKVVLMAPTGRAAKVFNSYSGFPASTIHRRIYRHSLRGEVPPLKDNRDNNTLYIVDEASMIGSSASTGNWNSDLLTDLITYIFAGTNNRLILLGDTAQLPPVGDIESPAMDIENLRTIGLKVSSATLTKVVRQGARSGILANAINVRRTMLQHPERIPIPITSPFDDVDALIPEDVVEAIDTAYQKFGINDTLIITRSNRKAADFNKAIRSSILYYEDELHQGEPLMIVKNNYYWTRINKRHDLGFIANGDILRITRVLGTETRYGFRFADIEVVPVSLEEEQEIKPMQVKIFLETLAGDQAALPKDRIRTLYENIIRQTYPNAPDPIQALVDDPYWNALQAKYAYCVTCHKAQGGQWSHVFVDMTYINPDGIGPELHRWMYTAVTRARQRLSFLVDAPSEW